MSQISREEPADKGAVSIRAAGVVLQGNLLIPQGAPGVVVFAHGSGSSRFSPRNRSVAEELRSGGVGTLLMDLLTSQEERVDIRTRHLRFDIELLSERVIGVVDWLGRQDATKGLSLGTFGSSTGAAAALIAAARRPHVVKAVVSRGGRPDLASGELSSVQAPTLLIVGGSDTQVIELNRVAMERMDNHVELELIPGAGHLFEGPGELKQVAQLARDWFVEHLL